MFIVPTKVTFSRIMLANTTVTTTPIPMLHHAAIENPIICPATNANNARNKYNNNNTQPIDLKCSIV